MRREIAQVNTMPDHSKETEGGESGETGMVGRAVGIVPIFALFTDT